MPGGQWDSTGFMSFSFLDALRKNHPAWRLLAAKNAPFIASFLHKAFIVNNRRQVAEQELAEDLDDFIAALSEGQEEAAFVRTGKEYLNEWVNDEHGWLRKFYPPGKDEPYFDITAQTQSAIEWLAGLKQKSFIGTESRLLTVFELLRQIIAGTEADPAQRLMELEKQKEAIEDEIKRVMGGEMATLSDTQIRERFWQAMTMARDILSDFRAVEQNFRDLDRALRERIAVWDRGKGELLATIFSEEDGITESEQGKSFSAFWRFLMSSDSREDLAKMLDKLLQLKPVAEMQISRDSKGIQGEWVEAGKHIQETIAVLSQQLRHYVDENYIEEEYRIGRILRSIEKAALSLRNNPPTTQWALEIDSMKTGIELPFDRPLHTPVIKAGITEDTVQQGSEDFSTDSLFAQSYVDKEKLAGNVYRLLQQRDAVSLTEIIKEHPLEQGVNELVMYLVIAGENKNAAFYDHILEVVAWQEPGGLTRRAEIPRVVFTR